MCCWVVAIPIFSYALETGEAEIVMKDHSELQPVCCTDFEDEFWGIADGSGENVLGKILMAVREDLRSGQVICQYYAETGICPDGHSCK